MAVGVKHRAYRYRCYPAPDQASNLARTFGCVRSVYNKALDARTKAWYRRKERVGYVETSALDEDLLGVRDGEASDAAHRPDLHLPQQELWAHRGP